MPLSTESARPWRRRDPRADAPIPPDSSGLEALRARVRDQFSIPFSAGVAVAAAMIAYGAAEIPPWLTMPVTALVAWVGADFALRRLHGTVPECPR